MRVWPEKLSPAVRGLLLAAIGFGGGCAAPDSGAPGGRYVVSAPQAQFYKYGPAQSFGADFVLPKGARVTMVQRSFGYSRVTTDQGITGYVSSDEVVPAPPEPALASSVPAQDRSGTNRAPKRSDVRRTPGAPLFDVNDVPMPLPGNPEPQPSSSPDFRF